MHLNAITSALSSPANALTFGMGQKTIHNVIVAAGNHHRKQQAGSSRSQRPDKIGQEERERQQSPDPALKSAKGN